MRHPRPTPSLETRLREALSILAHPPHAAPEPPTVARLCRIAHVSRNTVYRYHPQIAATVRRLRQGRSARSERAHTRLVRALRTELAAQHAELVALAALVDHYFAATVELRERLARRERELSALHARPRLRSVTQ